MVGERQAVGGGWAACGVEDARGRYARQTQVAVVVSVAGNAALFGLKLWAGLASGSLALQADAWHTISDSLSSLVVLAGVRLSVRPPDREHPFGHGRYELVATMLVGVLLGLVACYFGLDSVRGLLSGRQVDYGLGALVVTVASLAGKEGMAQYSFRVARLTGNRALEADGWHHRSDALSSLVVLLGIVAGAWVPWIDGALGLVVAALIGHVAYRTLRSTASAIVGERPPEDLKASVVRHVAELVPELALHPHDFRWHNYVHRQELTFHIILPPGMSVREATRITSRIEGGLLRAYRIEATVHVEAVD